jgi:uncharacterized membrane-anchored protein
MRVATFITCALLLSAPGVAAGQERKENDPFKSIPWEECPCTGRLGTEATVTVPAGFLFTGAAGTRKFLELNENPTNGSERGLIIRTGDDGGWFAVFEFSPSGYVSDDEKEQIDAAALLESLKEGSARGNEERRKRGWSEVALQGWHQEPHYDAVSSNLTWSTRVTGTGSAAQTPWVNHSVRLLGRAGVMNVDLVAGVSEVDRALPLLDQVIRGFSYQPGQKYSEWRAGDKVAEYGLTALIAGGAGVAVAKSGLLGKLGKFAVYLVIGFLALLKGLWSRLFGRNQETETPAPPPIPVQESQDGSR